MMKQKSYYLGLDIGTDSVGYAVTDESYKLMRFKGESMWGSGLFDPANACQDRRAARTARRRLDRRQLRIRLLKEFFAKAINDVDPRFFVRLRESALYAEDRTDKSDSQSLFNDATFKDADFHGKYPTIHHLIVDLIENSSAHDVRLVYIALAWLMAHRGHFLSEIKIENVSSLDDVGTLYSELMDYMGGPVESEDGETHEREPMWSCDAVAFGEILARRAPLSVKREEMCKLLWGSVKPPKSDDVPYDRKDVISLLCGSATVKPATLFKNDAYNDLPPIFLGAEDEKLEAVMAELGEDGELVRKLKALYDWAVLRDVRRGSTLISTAKVSIYEQHRKDLSALKGFLRRTDRGLYREIFVQAKPDCPNYGAYVNNVSGTKKAKKEEFSEWLSKKLSGVKPTDADRPFYDDMMSRLETCSFLPKQVEGDNRVIPHQLYQVELRAILKNAIAYLPFLSESDEYGSVADKIESIFAFRVPYFVGPLVDPDSPNGRGKFAWMKRKSGGVIRPWNFKELVDLDASEDEFIKRMTNVCMYVPGEDVLPAESLLYKEFALLNEINPLKIGGARLTADAKRRIIDGLYRSKRRVSRKALERFMLDEGITKRGDEISGIDEELKSNLSSYHDFKCWIEKGMLTESEVETIILRSTCTEDSRRFALWLGKAPFAANMNESDIRKIARLKYGEFGRLSRRLLDGVVFTCKESGATGTVIEFLRNENVVLMELLSDRYTLREKLDEIAKAYFADSPVTLGERLDEMYVSSAVKRQIYRALDIVKAVTKAMGGVPLKVFVEMARGGSPEQKGKRTRTRHQQLVDLYRGVRDDEVKQVNAELESMGAGVDNRLQSDALFLWHLQLGRCAYCGKPLPIEHLKNVANVDHIHPQSKVKDDSVMNNKVLCCSGCNGQKEDVYPVPAAQRQPEMWSKWHDLGLMTDEKYRRLMRTESLTDDDLQGFINRQLVETRQTTKAILTLLTEALPETEVVAVKAGNVSDFRHEFGLVKCRAVNDLHHAKDAYLNIVVGNVYHERFSRQFFRLSDGYTMKVGVLFGEHTCVQNEHGLAWDGAKSMARVKATMLRNDVHLTKYAFYSKGALFDLMPVGVDGAEIPRKAGLDVKKYGGYRKPAAAGYLPVGFVSGKKRDVLIVPVNLMDMPTIVGEDEAVAMILVKKITEQLNGKPISDVTLPFGRKLLKVNTVLSLDGFPFVLRGKSGGGKMYLMSSMRSLRLEPKYEAYVKRLESISEKMRDNKALTIDSQYDKVSAQDNVALYDVLCEIAESPAFESIPASQAKTLKAGRGAFCALGMKEQVSCLLSIVLLLKTNRAGGCDLTGVGGVAKAGVVTLSSRVSNWKKSYDDARFVFSDFAGLHRHQTSNLLELL